MQEPKRSPLIVMLAARQESKRSGGEALARAISDTVWNAPLSADPSVRILRRARY